MTHAEDAGRQALELLGMLHDGGDTVLLLGPKEPGFWPVFETSAEYRDGAPDPLDRWSKRVIGALADHWGGKAVFPSDGPPYPPFIAWAKATGRVWQSPAGLLVHDRQGLWLSFRGAVRLPGHLPLPHSSEPPCSSCSSQPCRTACPVSALGADAYDVAACHRWLDEDPAKICISRGCAARRACPVSQSYGRLNEQSAFHMKAFHGK